MRFLISRLSSLGDVVCSLPAAVALRNSFPQSEIIWAVSHRFVDIVSLCDAVSQVVPVHPALQPNSWPKFEGEFDAAFDLQGLLKSAVTVWRARKGIALGYHWQREGSRFFSSPVTPDPSSLHVVDQYVDVVRAYGADMDFAQFGLVPSSETCGDIAKRLETIGISKPYVLLNPGAGWATKRWPPAFFAASLAGIRELGLEPILIGGSDAAALAAARSVEAEVIKLGGRRPASLVGQTGLSELVAVIAGAAAHVGGDTGSTHIAAALGVPAIGLYSLTRPERCCPYGQMANTLYNPAGLAGIRPAEVLDRLRRAVQA